MLVVWKSAQELLWAAVRSDLCHLLSLLPACSALIIHYLIYLRTTFHQRECPVEHLSVDDWSVVELHIDLCLYLGNTEDFVCIQGEVNVDECTRFVTDH